VRYYIYIYRERERLYIYVYICAYVCRGIWVYGCHLMLLFLCPPPSHSPSYLSMYTYIYTHICICIFMYVACLLACRQVPNHPPHGGHIHHRHRGPNAAYDHLPPPQR
jgi:hypothetical protein